MNIKKKITMRNSKGSSKVIAKDTEEENIEIPKFK